MASHICEMNSIFYAYSDGIKEFSRYLSQNNPALLEVIFKTHAKEILQNGINQKMLDSLYIDKIIDEAGSLYGY